MKNFLDAEERGMLENTEQVSTQTIEKSRGFALVVNQKWK